MPAEYPSIKSAPFPGFHNVAGVDQGYAPLHFRHSVIDVRDRRVAGGKRSQSVLTFAFKPDEEQIKRLIGGELLVLHLWHDVIPPMRLDLGLSQEHLDGVRRLSCDPDQLGYTEWSRIKDEFHVHIFLDDIEQFHCGYADREEGHIIRCVTDDKGAPVREGEEWKTESAYGNVRFEFERIDQ